MNIHYLEFFYKSLSFSALSCFPALFPLIQLNKGTFGVSTSVLKGVQEGVPDSWLESSVFLTQTLVSGDLQGAVCQFSSLEILILWQINRCLQSVIWSLKHSEIVNAILCQKNTGGLKLASYNPHDSFYLLFIYTGFI